MDKIYVYCPHIVKKLLNIRQVLNLALIYVKLRIEYITSMKQTLLYIFICISTCTLAQGISQSFVAADNYGIAFSISGTDPTITIFPNPTADFITIDDAEGKVATVSFFNLLGKIVATHEISGNKKFNLMEYQNGIYLVQLKDVQGKVIQTVRIKKI